MIDRSVGSIAVFRALKLGDMLCATPALRTIRHHWPEAHIALIALPWFQELADRYSHLFDEMITFPGYPGLPEQQSWTPGESERFIAEMRSRQFDLVIQMHGSGEITNPLTHRFGSRWTAGFYAPSMQCPNPATFLPWVEEQSETLRYLHLLEHLGISPRGSFLELPVLDAEWRDLDRLRAELGFEDAPFVCVHPGASVPERRWDSASFAQIADRLTELGYKVVMTGNPEERDLVNRTAKSMRHPAADLCGRTSLGVLAALTSRAKMVVCNDTGLSHIAAATQTPSVVISPVSDPRRWGPLDRRRHRIVDARGGASVDDVWCSIESLLHECGVERAAAAE
jgi:ADP-heptose:LPS heptosyltransferase